MAQIRNFGFEPPVQEFDVSDAPHPRCGHRQHARLAAGDEFACGYPRHTDAHRPRPWGFFLLRHRDCQCAYRIVYAV